MGAACQTCAKAEQSTKESINPTNVIAATPVQNEETVIKFLLKVKLFQRLPKELVTKPPSPKTEQERQDMIEALKNNDNLMSVVSLSDKNLDSMVDLAWKEINASTKLITEGDLHANYFYVVQDR